MDKNYIAQLYNDKVLTSVGVLNAIQKGWITTEDAVEILGSDTALDTIRTAKLLEISKACNAVIVAGIDVQIGERKLYNQGTMTFYAHENVENLGVYIFSCSFTRALICGKIIINDVVSVQPQKEIEMKTTDINKVRYTNRWRIVYGICNN